MFLLCLHKVELALDWLAAISVVMLDLPHNSLNCTLSVRYIRILCDHFLYNTIDVFLLPNFYGYHHTWII